MMGLEKDRALGVSGQPQGLDSNLHNRVVCIQGPEEDRLGGKASVGMAASHYSLCLLLMVVHRPLQGCRNTGIQGYGVGAA